MPHPRADKMTNAPPPGRQDDKCPGDGHAWNSVLKHYVVLSTYKGALSNDDDDDGSENITKKRNFAPFQTSENFIASIWNRSIRQM